MTESAFTRLVGCRYPVQSVPIPGIATVEFVAAICNAGGLGMLPGSMAPADAVRGMCGKLRELTDAPHGVNFLIPFLEPGYAAVSAAAEHARVVEFFYGEPDPELVALAHAGGALCSWQVGSLEEARAAEAAGCDFIIQQGVEAGGHVRGTTDLAAVLTPTLEAVRVPVLAAGGIATGADFAAAIAAGAAGVRVGTRFVCSRESSAHEAYKQALVAADADDTTYTEAFSVMWPHAPHRVLQSAIDAADACDEEVVGEWTLGGERLAIPRNSVIAPTADTTGRIEAMALYAGRSVAGIEAVESIEQIMADLVGA